MLNKRMIKVRNTIKKKLAEDGKISNGMPKEITTKTKEEDRKVITK